MIRATIDLSRINVNYSCLSKDKNDFAVLKADAYGHGLSAVARSLLSAGCRRFAVAAADEAATLRALAPYAEILLLCPPEPCGIPALIDMGVTFACGSLAFAEALAAQASGTRRARVHLALNSGMNRMGFSLAPADFAPTLALLFRILASPRLTVTGVYTHLAEGPASPRTARQCARFSAAARHLFSRRPELLFHMAATPNLTLAALFPSGARTALRIGLGLYGYGDARVSPAMMLEASVLETGLLHRGERIGYGAGTPQKETCETALLSVGYADGLPRLSSGAVLRARNGAPLPILGRVSMNLCSVDARASRLRAGDLVTLLDFGGRCMQSLCAAAGCIPYELLLAGRGARRRYLGQK